MKRFSLPLVLLSVLILVPSVVVAEPKLPLKPGQWQQQHEQAQTGQQRQQVNKVMKPGAQERKKDGTNQSLDELKQPNQLIPADLQPVDTSGSSAKNKPNFNTAYEQHRTLLERRLRFIDNNPHLTAEKKELLQTDIEEEMSWMDTMQQRLDAATSAEERQSLFTEIREHVADRRESRRQDLAQQTALPSTSPVDRAKTITQHFQTIEQQLHDHGHDTTDLSATIDQYQQAVMVLEQAYTALTNDKTVEHLQQLSESLTTVRQQGAEVRNRVQTIVVQ